MVVRSSLVPGDMAWALASVQSLHLFWATAVSAGIRSVSAGNSLRVGVGLAVHTELPHYTIWGIKFESLYAGCSGICGVAAR